jgi:hypothetical protein
VLPGGEREEAALAGEVEIQRLKFHYFESYAYDMSVTPDALEVGRRAATWIMLYMWRRGLFEVQYAGMSADARAEALAARAGGVEGGMPVGAVLSAKAAFTRWTAGERAYVPELGSEPLFVRLDAQMRYTTGELHAEEVGSVFSDVGKELGLEPHASGLNSGRRNGVVGTSKALEERGMSQVLAKKLMQHRARGGAGAGSTIESNYDDSTATSDMGALLMGRAMMPLASRRGLLATRCPELAEVRVFSDIARDDPVRVELASGTKNVRMGAIGLT